MNFVAFSKVLDLLATTNNPIPSSWVALVECIEEK